MLTVTAFWRDKFDFITVEDVAIADASGRQTVRAFRVNGDFARVRGLEASYFKRIGRKFTGQVSASVSKATGLSSTNNDALQQYLQNGGIDNTVETPLAWDRPYDVKGSLTYSHGNGAPLFGVPGLRRFRVYLSSTLRAGQRYTPAEFVGQPAQPGDRRGRLAAHLPDRAGPRGALLARWARPWWWFDLSAERRFRIGKNDLAASLEVTNLFDQDNSVIVNPVTGRAYPRVDRSRDFTELRGNADYDVLEGVRDPRYEDPSTTGLPPFNPARYLPQRHILFGLAYRF